MATETSTATQVEVLRGPATLFYGNDAEFVYQVSSALKTNSFADYIQVRLVNRRGE